MILTRYIKLKTQTSREKFFDQVISPISLKRKILINYTPNRNYAKKKLNLSNEVRPTGGLFNIDKTNHEIYDKIKSCKR